MDSPKVAFFLSCRGLRGLSGKEKPRYESQGTAAGGTYACNCRGLMPSQQNPHEGADLQRTLKTKLLWTPRIPNLGVKLHHLHVRVYIDRAHGNQASGQASKQTCSAPPVITTGLSGIPMTCGLSNALALDSNTKETSDKQRPLSPLRGETDGLETLNFWGVFCWPYIAEGLLNARALTVMHWGRLSPS